jgi:glycerol-3-phosphate acyltransferase PlsX
VGRSSAIRDELNAQLAAASARDLLVEAATRFEIIEAPDVIEMTDKPSVAIRGKPNSSMAVGIRLQAEGKSDAFVSAGNTGAQMAASTFVLRLHEGLSRPAIGTVFPTAKQPVVVLDSGANVDCSAKELVQFARLGSVYARDILGRANPAIGLLSIGEEAEKGNAAVKEAHQALLGAGLNFIGNVEGRDIPMGACDRGPIDVVVCDGFTGNVLLKFYESVAPMLFGMLARAGVTKEQLGAVVHSLDYAKYGGAPLLGVKGVSIICHGKSSPEAIKNGILAGLRAVESRMSQHIGEQLAT